MSDDELVDSFMLVLSAAVADTQRDGDEPCVTIGSLRVSRRRLAQALTSVRAIS